MKIIYTTLLLLSCIATSFAQNASKLSETKVSAVKKIDNYTIQYLLIFNDKEELLMMKNNLGWHTPVIRSNEPKSIREALNDLAKSIGLTVDNIRLSGLYTHKFEGVPDHPEVCFRSHYTARFVSGEIRQPEQEVSYQWVPVKECLEKFHFDFLRQQTAPIIKNRNKVWGGTFLIIWENDQFKGSTILEEIYELSN